MLQCSEAIDHNSRCHCEGGETCDGREHSKGHAPRPRPQLDKCQLLSQPRRTHIHAPHLCAQDARPGHPHLRAAETTRRRRRCTLLPVSPLTHACACSSDDGYHEGRGCCADCHLRLTNACPLARRCRNQPTRRVAALRLATASTSSVHTHA